MCGLLLYLNKEEGVDLGSFQKALNLQESRGPDDYGIVCINNLASKNLIDIRSLPDPQKSKPQLVIGHRRLSIIDTSTDSRQPFIDNNSSTFLAYNGEFYNFEDFATKATKHSDALTLFDFFKSKTIYGLEEVNGMWATIFGDLNKNKIYLSRDRYGKKPLYFYHDRNRFIVSSEIKSIYSLTGSLRQVDPKALGYFFIGKLSPYLNDGSSFYKNINSVKPGEIISYDLNRDSIFHERTVGFKQTEASFTQKSEDELAAELSSDLEDAVKLRLRSDVKVGILVSGGVDSSSIAGIAAKSGVVRDLSFYTCHIVGNDNSVTEDLYYSRELAKKLDIKLLEISLEELDQDSFFRTAKKLSGYAELPLNLMLSCIPTYLISEKMKDDGIGVAIDGVGGDEIMGGYPSYQSMSLANVASGNFSAGLRLYFEWIKQFRPGIRNASTFLSFLLYKASLGRNKKELHNPLIQTLSEHMKSEELRDSIESLHKNYFFRNNLTSHKERQIFEVNKYQLPYYLGTSDHFNMINSVENRSPFLDYRLNKYLGINENLKLQKGFNKFLLRKSMPKSIPDSIRWRRGKIGIGTPYSNNNIFSQRSKEMVLDSSFVRSIATHEVILKDFNLSKALFRPLFSLALLESHYDLHI